MISSLTELQLLPSSLPDGCPVVAPAKRSVAVALQDVKIPTGEAL